MDKMVTGGGAIEAALFQQSGNDPNQPGAERDAQINEVANLITSFVRGAATTLDLAVYDFRLSGSAADVSHATTVTVNADSDGDGTGSYTQNNAGAAVSCLSASITAADPTSSHGA